MTVAERAFHVNGYRLAAREWHAEADKKVIALHGWLDNAASFDVLAAQIQDCHIVALDLPGHGLSDHKSHHASYNIWDDLLDILAVADAMGWQHFQLLGHSRGAMMSLLLAAAKPDRVQRTVLLDGLIPMPVTIEDTATQLGRFLTESLAVGKKKPPRYDSIELAVKARCRASGMNAGSAKVIAERGLEQCEGVYCWSSDPRLRVASAFKMSEQHNTALLESLVVPTLVLLAEQGLGAHPQTRETLETYSNMDYRLLPGSHHFHMEEQATDIAQLVQCFFNGSLQE